VWRADDGPPPIRDGRVDASLRPHRLGDLSKPVLHERVWPKDRPVQTSLLKRLLHLPVLAGDGRVGMIRRAERGELHNVFDVEPLRRARYGSAWSQSQARFATERAAVWGWEARRRAQHPVDEPRVAAR